jgi:hypothetical protein
MFASQRPPRRTKDPAALAALAQRAAPLAASRTQLLPVPEPCRGLLVDGGMRRGTTIGVTAGPAGGSTTLALSLLSAASAAGSWCLIVGLPDLGLTAAGEVGLELDRLTMVPWPGAHWAAAVAAAIESIDLVLLAPPPHPKDALARRLASRLRDRRGVLVILDARRWPQPCDVTLHVEAAHWVAVGAGQDCLRQRLATVTASGRRQPGSPRHQRLWLPDDSRAIRQVEAS